MNETPMKSKSSKSSTITKTLKNAGFLHIGNYDDLDYFVIPKSGRLLLRKKNIVFMFSYDQLNQSRDRN